LPRKALEKRPDQRSFGAEFIPEMLVFAGDSLACSTLFTLAA
jgi:hypothetical protein